MRLLLVGADENNSTDGVIVQGIRYLLNRAYPNAILDYKMIEDINPQFYYSFNPATVYDMIVVCGTPWLWDSFQNSHKYQNLITCFKTHAGVKRLFLGIGSCLNIEDVGSNILKRPEEIEGIKQLFSNATVIVRDSVASNILNHSGIEHAFLPCPAYFCYGDKINVVTTFNNVLVFQNPLKSISAGNWAHPDKLNAYYGEMKHFHEVYNPLVVCANVQDMDKAKELFGEVTLLKTYKDTMDLMQGAKKVMSGRVHCAVPAIVSGADTQLMSLDTRYLVVAEFRDQDTQAYLPIYDKILKKYLCVK